MTIIPDSEALLARLDTFSPAYNDEFQYALDNELVLNWYPGRIMALAKGDSLLELGLGHGYSTTRFASHFTQHVVIDGSTEIITQFQRKYPECRAQIVHQLFESYETTERFDSIVMGFILEHVDDPAAILCKYRKFLKPGGSVFVTVPNAEALNKRFGHDAGLIRDLYALGPGDIQLGHQRVFSVATLEALANEQGYKSIHVEGIFLKPITTDQIKQLKLSPAILNAMMTVGVNYPELCVGILMELKDATP